MNVKAYKTKLRLTPAEKRYFNQMAGSARYTWNWMLGIHDELTRDSENKPRIAGGNAKNPDNPSIKKRFRDVIDQEHSFMRRYPSQIVDNVAVNLNTAFSHYWRKRKNGEVSQAIAKKIANGESWNRWLRRQLKNGRKGVQVEPHYPQYKAKQHYRPSFSLSNSEVRDGMIKIPAARGSEYAGHWFRLAEKDYLPAGKHNTTTFSQDGYGDWYVSVAVEHDPETVETTGEILGVDIGVATAVATSDGDLYANNRHMAKYEKRMRILQKKLARQEKGSRNWEKTKAKIKRLHAKINKARTHDRHDITADIIYHKRPSLVRVEDLRVQNMTGAARPKKNPDGNGNGYLPNRKKQKAGLNRAILEVAPYELRRQLEYKGEWAGVHVEAVDPAYTSQTCSQCGHVAAENRKTQADFTCVQCGYHTHADINAACVIRDKNP